MDRQATAVRHETHYFPYLDIKFVNCDLKIEKKNMNIIFLY